MSIQVTIELTDDNAKWLRSMASLGRMCDSIARALNRAQEDGVECLSDGLLEDLHYAEKLIMEAKPTLMNIEYCRQQLIEANVPRLWKSETHSEEAK